MSRDRLAAMRAQQANLGPREAGAMDPFQTYPGRSSSSRVRRHSRTNSLAVPGAAPRRTATVDSIAETPELDTGYTWPQNFGSPSSNPHSSPIPHDAPLDFNPFAEEHNIAPMTVTARRGHAYQNSSSVPPSYAASVRSRASQYEAEVARGQESPSHYSSSSSLPGRLPRRGSLQKNAPAPIAAPSAVQLPRMSVSQDAMDSFFQEISEIQTSTREIAGNVTRIETLHSRSLNTVPNSAEYNRISKDLARVKTETRASMNEIRERIKLLESSNSQAPTPQDANVKRTQTAAAKDRFMESIQRYSQVEAAHRQANKVRLAKQYMVINPNATDVELEECMNDPNAGEQMFKQATMSTRRSGEASAALNAVQARQADLKQIEYTIVELAQLFQDMAMMTEEQDVAICAIEEKAETTEKDMEAAHENLVKAKYSAISARSKRKVCFGICLVLILVLGALVAYLAVKYTRNNGSNDALSQAAAEVTVTQVVTSTRTAARSGTAASPAITLMLSAAR